MKTIAGLITLIISISIAVSCQSVDDERIPNMAVQINLSNIGLWNTYGVNGFGTHRNFILAPGVRVPANFPYTERSATGFGGVLLISGMDPYNPTVNSPLAYDLACPVERKSDIRVVIDDDTYIAVCPECGSTYDVTMAGGAPMSGPAFSGKYKYGLRSYRCYATGDGGYVITN